MTQHLRIVVHSVHNCQLNTMIVAKMNCRYQHWLSRLQQTHQTTTSNARTMMKLFTKNRPDESTSGTSNTTNNVLQFDDNDEDNVPDESLVNSESQIETNRNDNDVPNSDGVHIESITNYEPQIESDSDGNGDVTGLSNQTFNENGDNEPSQPNATDFDFDEIIDSRSEQNEQAGMSLTDSDNSSTENAVIISRPDIKNELEVVQMDAVDELAISSIFNSNETASGISNLV